MMKITSASLVGSHIDNEVEYKNQKFKRVEWPGGDIQWMCNQSNCLITPDITVENLEKEYQKIANKQIETIETADQVFSRTLCPEKGISDYNKYVRDLTLKAMKEYAKKKVKEALKEASNQVYLYRADINPNSVRDLRQDIEGCYSEDNFK